MSLLQVGNFSVGDVKFAGPFRSKVTNAPSPFSIEFCVSRGSAIKWASVLFLEHLMPTESAVVQRFGKSVTSHIFPCVWLRQAPNSDYSRNKLTVRSSAIVFLFVWRFECTRTRLRRTLMLHTLSWKSNGTKKKEKKERSGDLTSNGQTRPSNTTTQYVAP